LLYAQEGAGAWRCVAPADQLEGIRPLILGITIAPRNQWDSLISYCARLNENVLMPDQLIGKKMG